MRKSFQVSSGSRLLRRSAKDFEKSIWRVPFEEVESLKEQPWLRNGLQVM
jgi:hypothetical protein